MYSINSNITEINSNITADMCQYHNCNAVCLFSVESVNFEPPLVRETQSEQVKHTSNFISWICTQPREFNN